MTNKDESKPKEDWYIDEDGATHLGVSPAGREQIKPYPGGTTPASGRRSVESIGSSDQSGIVRAGEPTAHPGEDTVVCPRCHQPVTRTTYAEHEADHIARMRNTHRQRLGKKKKPNQANARDPLCPVCKSPVAEKWMESHLQKVHGVQKSAMQTMNSALYRCIQCGALLTVRDAKSHFQKEHTLRGKTPTG